MLRLKFFLAVALLGLAVFVVKANIAQAGDWCSDACHATCQGGSGPADLPQCAWTMVENCCPGYDPPLCANVIQWIGTVSSIKSNPVSSACIERSDEECCLWPQPTCSSDSSVFAYSHINVWQGTSIPAENDPSVTLYCECSTGATGPCPAAPSCKSLGDSCSTATECCSGLFCEGAKCRTCNVDFCSYRGATSQATSASCRVGNNVCSDLLSAVGIPESACASGTCDCCGPCLDDGASGCISAGDCCNHNCVGGVCQSPPCAPSCPDPSTYCANQHPSNGCGGSCSALGTKQPSCPAPSTYCPGQEPDNGCGQKCPAGTKTPNCSCAANTCTGSTCSNGCGGTCAGTKDCTNYPTCSLRNLSCPTSANVGSNFNVSYEYFNTGPSSPYEVRMGLTNIQPAAGCTSGSGDVLWCQSSNINGQGSWSSESRTVKCPAAAGNFKITAGCFTDAGSFTCPANTYSGGDINEKQECTVNCVAPATCTPDTSQACCTGTTNLWDNTATNPNKATATGVWLLSSQFPESAPPNNQAQCCSDDASEVYISPTNTRACDGTAACCNTNDYVMNGQCYTAFSLPSPANARSTAQTTTSITWAWNAVSGATYYLAHLNNNTPVNVGNVTTRLQSGLTPNTSYWLEVAACNLCGCSAYSPRVTVNTLSGNQPPGQPTLEPVP